MDTPRPTQPPAFDHVAVARWNHGIAVSRRAYDTLMASHEKHDAGLIEEDE